MRLAVNQYRAGFDSWVHSILTFWINIRKRYEMAKQKKYHFIYKTTCIITGKFYVGMHSTDNLEDGYLGSGKILGYSRKKYGDENHKIERLEFLQSREELKQREKEIVNEQLLSDPLNMNLKYGGDGGWDHLNKDSEIQRRKCLKGNAKQRELWQNDPEWKAKLQQTLHVQMKQRHKDGTLKVPDWTGRKHSEEAKRKMSETRKQNAALKKAALQVSE